MLVTTLCFPWVNKDAKLIICTAQLRKVHVAQPASPRVSTCCAPGALRWGGEATEASCAAAGAGPGATALGRSPGPAPPPRPGPVVREGAGLWDPTGAVRPHRGCGTPGGRRSPRAPGIGYARRRPFHPPQGRTTGGERPAGAAGEPGIKARGEINWISGGLRGNGDDVACCGAVGNKGRRAGAGAAGREDTRWRPQPRLWGRADMAGRLLRATKPRVLGAGWLD